MTDYRDALAVRAASAPLRPGSTSYFAKPDATLDPALFQRGRLIPAVRTQVLTTLYNYWQGQFRQPQSWSQVWIAGSAASYQWSAARAPGDLDVLIGVDYRGFRAANDAYEGLSDFEITEYMNDGFRDDLDPHTSRTNFNGTVYEVTFYVNPGATDIRSIHPYAAYNLSTNEWTVSPDENPKAPNIKEFKDKAKLDTQRAKEILRDYEKNRKAILTAKTPEHKLNAESWLKFSIEQAAMMFDEIHEGRHAAFRGAGQGYGDWANYRWQAGKASGIVPALQELKAIKKHAQDSISAELYGAPITDAEHALLRAALWRAGQ